MQNIVRIEGENLARLVRAAKIADEFGSPLRMMTGTDNHGEYFKYAIGGGMWTPPIYTAWRE